MSQMNRRYFLAAAGAAIGTQVATNKVRSEFSSESIGIGCIGIGNRGTALLRNLLNIKGIEVRAICDINPAHLDRATTLIKGGGQKEPLRTAEWKKLLEWKQVDAVVSALPCDLHAVNYQDVIASGKHLYGEKPMCLTLEDCNAVMEAASKSKQITQIGFQRRADPRFIEPIRQIHQGELGEMVEGRIHWSNAWGPLYDWFGQRKRSGDWMVEQAVHNWDVMNWATKSIPVTAMGMGRDNLFRSKQPDRDVHDYYSAIVEYDNGTIVNILHSWVAPGKEGAFNPRFNEEHTKLIGTQAGIDFNNGVFSYRKELGKPDRPATQLPANINNTLLALHAFVESIRNNTPPIATVQHGRDAVLACLLVRESVYRRKLVTVKDLLG